MTYLTLHFTCRASFLFEKGERSRRRATSGASLEEAPCDTYAQTVQYTSANGTRDRSNHLKSLLVPSRVSLRKAGTGQSKQVARKVKGNRERVVLDVLSDIQRERSSGDSL